VSTHQRVIPLLFLLLLSPGAARAAAVPLIQGFYYRGPGVSLIEPCGFNKGYWVDKAGSAARTMFDQYDALTRRDFEKAYVSLHGDFRDLRPSDGVPKEYAGVLKVTGVLAVRSPLPADCK